MRKNQFSVAGHFRNPCDAPHGSKGRDEGAGSTPHAHFGAVLVHFGVEAGASEGQQDARKVKDAHAFQYLNLKAQQHQEEDKATVLGCINFRSFYFVILPL